MVKYRGRKKYSKADAKDQIELLSTALGNSLEAIGSWQRNIATGKRDYLIEALCHQSHEEMIEKELDTIEYIQSKIEYIRQYL